MNRVEQLRDRTTQALDAAEIDYAVIGGIAVAAWISSVDPHAVRTTKDVDLLVRRSDLVQIVSALRPIGLELIEVDGMSMFVESANPTPKYAVHLVFANERVKDSDALVAPDVAGAVQSAMGFRIVRLIELVKMKLQAFRLRDQTHLVDLMHIGLIDASWKEQLPAELQDRYQQVLEAFEREGPQP